MLKKLIASSLALLLVLSTITSALAVTAENTTKTETDTSVQANNNSEHGYRAYQAANSGFTNAMNEIKVQIAENAKLEKVGDKLTVQFVVEEDGWYEPHITYCALEGTGGDVLIDLLLDGESAYDQMSNLALTRLWKNTTEDFQTDEEGNEFSPEQVEVFEWQTTKLFDSEGFVTEPLCVALTKGEHELTIVLNSECVEIGSIQLAEPEALLGYEEYRKLYDESNYVGNKLIFEGEHATYKNQKTYIPLSARNDADVSPVDPFTKLNNYIGGSNWKNTGGTITWEIEAPQDGWYQIGFHFRQTYLQESNSYRTLLIDGEIPFSEAKSVAFGYKSGWQYMTLANGEGEAQLVYLSQGKHTLSLRVTLGDLADFAAQLQSVTSRLGVLYRQIVKITGESPDANRDYALFTALPELEDELTDISQQLEALALFSETVAGTQGGSNAAILRKANVTIQKMLDTKYEAHTKLSSFYDNYSSLSSWLYEMQNMALDIDTVILMEPGTNYKDMKVGFLRKIGFMIQRLWASFTENDTQVEDDDTIVIWSNWGRDQLTVLENLIVNDFTPKTGIKVSIKITSAGAVQGKLSGNGPDLEINTGRNSPVNYAMRGIAVDLSQFDDFDEVIKRFGDTSLVPYQYENGVYGIPNTETYPMLFIRTDIFEELGLEIPETWDDFIDCAKIINLNNMNCAMPQIVETILTQMGVSIYNEDLTATNLMSSGSVNAFEFWTDFYTKYSFPKTYDFFNRFRTGLMPMGIADFSTYATIKAAAPEINGKWKMYELPGFEQDDGTINNAATGNGTACVILNWSTKQDKAWEFLKWWTSDDIQYRFGVNIESVLGTSGRYDTANRNALYRLGWEADNLDALKAQGQKLQQQPEVPGGYYVSRSIQQVYWNVANQGQKVEEMLKKWIPEADDEIRRKTEEYAN